MGGGGEEYTSKLKSNPHLGMGVGKSILTYVLDTIFLKAGVVYFYIKEFVMSYCGQRLSCCGQKASTSITLTNEEKSNYTLFFPQEYQLG